ncbi:hypothetical protein [Gracilimonas mengyeensis]|uniref:Lipoprotein n=1 Tax=Gracilimonas mengyeensis TaxID=1302730 RepID=A0A521E040_9BACT|nr:hypothetical protein [Gracilimonas mengyeensis]SMO77323.1 hypothetical protein SAMN06265219_11021 [Gracilimonas mengyeensis]
MRKLYPFTLILFVLFLSACTQDGIVSTNYTIKAGQSFGMCIGNCFQELSLNSREAVLRVDDRGLPNNEEAEVYAKTEVSAEEWNRWTSSVDKEVFLALDDVYGCPDCADGGAEWLEIQSPDINKKVVFEYHNPPAAIADLVEELREKRDEMFEQ